MNEFIHTLSLTSHMSLEQKENLQESFKEEFFFNSEKKMYVLYKYAQTGLRMEIKLNPEKEKRYDKAHPDYKIEIIITPAKALYRGEIMAKLFTEEEYFTAFEKLTFIFKEIESLCGVNLLNELKVHRIDVTKDIKTESDEYSKEVIRLAKKALYKTGYNLWIPTEDDVAKTGWLPEYSVMFNNHNQEVNIKIYNKLADLKNQSYDVSNIKGLLRFELSLKRQYLKTHSLLKTKNIAFEEIPQLLCNILKQAPDIMQTHIAGPLWSGDMLSKKLQKKYIRKYCKNRKSKCEKMLNYCDNFNKGIISASGKIVDYFSELGLSPLHTSKEFDYIPSFASLLDKEENVEIKNFVKSQPRKKCGI